MSQKVKWVTKINGERMFRAKDGTGIRYLELGIRYTMSGKRDSNPRPLAWEANALPTELLPLLISNLRKGLGLRNSFDQPTLPY